jgi:hypothetical protein
LRLRRFNLLANVILIHHKSSALDHRPRHFEVLGSQVKVCQQIDEVGGQNSIDSCIYGDFLETKATIVNWLTNDLIESPTCHFKLTITQINNALVEPINNLQVKLFTTLIPLLLVRR